MPKNDFWEKWYLAFGAGIASGFVVLVADILKDFSSPVKYILFVVLTIVIFYGYGYVVRWSLNGGLKRKLNLSVQHLEFLLYLIILLAVVLGFLFVFQYLLAV